MSFVDGCKDDRIINHPAGLRVKLLKFDLAIVDATELEADNSPLVILEDVNGHQSAVFDYITEHELHEVTIVVLLGWGRN